MWIGRDLQQWPRSPETKIAKTQTTGGLTTTIESFAFFNIGAGIAISN